MKVSLLHMKVKWTTYMFEMMPCNLQENFNPLLVNQLCIHQWVLGWQIEVCECTECQDPTRKRILLERNWEFRDRELSAAMILCPPLNGGDVFVFRYPPE